MRYGIAVIGMIVRSIAAVALDYLNFQAQNRAGAIFGLAVNVPIICALRLPQSRGWFSRSPIE